MSAERGMTEVDLSAVPVTGPVPPVRVTGVSQTVLPNGVAVMVVPRPTVPRVEFRLSLPAGAAMGPSAAAAELLAMGIPLGTAELDQAQLAERIQDLGGSLHVSQDHDRLYLQAAALSEAEEELYRLLADLVMAPQFPAHDLATERAKLVEGLRMARAEPHFPAGEGLGRLIYGDHPYGRPEPSETTVRRTGRRALLDLHRRSFSPWTAQITVVGDVDARRTQARLRRAFSPWQGPRHVPGLPAVRAGRSDEIHFIGRPGSVQTVVVAGSSGPTHGHPDHVALTLATAVLGGGFTSRMMNNLREDKGYTYSPHARLSNHLLDGLATASMEVRNEVTGAAYLELVYELGRLASLEVPREEIETTRSYLSGSRVIMLQTQAGLATALAQVRAHGLDHRYLERYSKQLAQTSAQQVMAAARRYLAPTAMTFVMVGDPEAASQLEALAPVRMVRSANRV
ncbi:MAG TPA: pitrilysin family protein [Candidatus Nanopelagicaceae bacterium]|nr:pitrilysin family protein [Candidatus Nanopelagicaceae bacterium]